MTPKLEWRDAGLSMHDMTMRYAAEVPDLGLWLLVMRSRGAWSCDIGLRSGERWCAAEDCATHEEAQLAGEAQLANWLREHLEYIDPRPERECGAMFARLEGAYVSLTTCRDGTWVCVDLRSGRTVHADTARRAIAGIVGGTDTPAPAEPARYRLTNGALVHAPDGEWVAWSDVAAVVAEERDALTGDD